MDELKIDSIIDLVERAGQPVFTTTSEFIICKEKILAGDYDSVTKKELKEFVGALKTAESKLNRQGGPIGKEFAFILRRFLYHADELGFPEFAQLRKKWRWSFL